MGLETFQKALRRCRIKFGDEWDQSQLSSSNRLGARAKKLKSAFSQWEAPLAERGKSSFCEIFPTEDFKSSYNMLV